MSFWLLIIALSIHQGWFYDESQVSDQHRSIAMLVALGLAFVAWMVEHIADAIKEGKK